MKEKKREHVDEEGGGGGGFGVVVFVSPTLIPIPRDLHRLGTAYAQEGHDVDPRASVARPLVFLGNVALPSGRRRPGRVARIKEREREREREMRTRNG